MDFTVTITDKAKLAAIGRARDAANAEIEAANASLPEDTKPAPTHASDADYVQFVMDRAAASWAVQFKD